MSLWDDLGASFSGTSVLGPLLLGAAAIGSSVISSNANNRAAEEARRAEDARAQAIQQGNANAMRYVEEQRAGAEPAVSRLRSIAITPPEELTPEQRAGLNDVQLAAGRSLNASGLRGSGRAATAVIKKTTGDFINSSVAANRARADNATSQLSNQYASGTTQAANISSGTGQALGQAAVNAGNVDANRETANAGVTTSALADVASILADSTKKRESRFGQSDEVKLRDQERRDYGERPSLG